MSASGPPHEVERAFLEALRSNPADDDTRSVYADWLDEQGRGDRADYIRLNFRIRALEPAHPMHGELQRRVDRLRRVLPSEWLAVVTAPPPPPPEPETRVRVAVPPRDPRLPLPPRPRVEDLPPPPSRRPVRAVNEAEEPLPGEVPTLSVASQLFGLDSLSLAPRRCRSCESTIGRWALKCFHCGTWQLRILRGLSVVAFVVVAVAVLIDDLRWQMKDDHYISGQPRGCSR